MIYQFGEQYLKNTSECYFWPLVLANGKPVPEETFLCSKICISKWRERQHKDYFYTDTILLYDTIVYYIVVYYTILYYFYTVCTDFNGLH